MANASHELRTPLTVMRTALEVTLAKPSYTPEQITLMAAKVRRSIDQAEHTIDALLEVATSDQGLTSREYVDLSTAAEDALENVAKSVSEHHLDLDVDLLQAEVTGDRVLLERMVANVIDSGSQRQALIIDTQADATSRSILVARLDRFIIVIQRSPSRYGAGPMVLASEIAENGS